MESRQRTANRGLISLSLVLLLLFFLTYLPGFLFSSGGAVLLWVIFTMINWRCPRCRAVLSITSSEPTCERCGFNYKTGQLAKGEGP